MRIRSGHLVGGAAFMLLPLALAAPLGLAPLFSIAGIAALIILMRRGEVGSALIPTNLVGWTIVLLMGWSLITALWAIDPAASLRKWGQLALILIGGLCLVRLVRDFDDDDRSIVETGLIAGTVLGLALAIQDMATDAWLRGYLQGGVDDRHDTALTRLNSGGTVAALLIWPATLALWRRHRIAAAILFVAAAVVIVRLASGAAVLGLAGGAVVGAAAYAWPRLAPRAAAAAIVIGVLVSPLLPDTVLEPDRIYAAFPDLYSPSIHRLYIWEHTAARIGEKPLLGWGLDAARDMPDRDLSIRTLNPRLAVEPYQDMTLVPLHPHNAALQVWLELGVPGAIGFALLAAGLIAVRIGTPDRGYRAAVRAATVAAFIVCATAYGFWQSWWLGGLWLVAAVMISLAAPPAFRPARHRQPHPARPG